MQYHLSHQRCHVLIAAAPDALLQSTLSTRHAALPAERRYFIDTDAAGVATEHQVVTLQYRADASVATSDEPPVVLGRLPAAFVQQMGAKLRPGMLLRFTIRDGGIQFSEGCPVGAALHYEGPANQRRGRTDLISKILFQYHARRDALGFEALMAAAQCCAMESADADSSGVALTDASAAAGAPAGAEDSMIA